MIKEQFCRFFKRFQTLNNAKKNKVLGKSSGKVLIFSLPLQGGSLDIERC